MSIICEDIPNTEEVKKGMYAGIPSLVHVRYVGESKIPGIDATKLAPCVLPVYYKKIAAEVEAMKVYEDDVFVTSFPKSGTTWTQEMVWLIANDLDFERAKNVTIGKRYELIEMSALMSDLSWFRNENSVKIIDGMQRPRFIKSHLPIALLPTEFWTVKPKLVYVTRNPKDAAISYYHHFFNIHRYQANLEEYLDAFLNDFITWSPYREHVMDYWKLRNEPNILILSYEELSTDLRGVQQKVARFFGKTFTDEQFEQLAKHLSFNEMRNNEAVNYEDVIQGIENQYGSKRPNPNHKFIRRGQVGSARDEMPVEYQKKFDEWLAMKDKNTDFRFNI